MISKAKPLVLHIITGLNDGGAEAVLFNLIHSSTEFKHAVISLMGPGKYGPMMEEAGIHVSYLELSPNRPSPLKLMHLFRIVRSLKPDVVQTWMYHADFLGGLAAWCAGVRAIVWGLHHSTVDKGGAKWRTRQLVRLNALISSWLPFLIVTCSKKGAQVHGEIGYPPAKMVVVHNGYDTDAFKPDPVSRALIRSEFGVADDQLLLGCVARYNPQKDHRNLIFAFAEVLKIRPDSHLLLIGPGLTPENTDIVALLDTTGTQRSVTLVGPRKDVPALMNGLDLHVLSSLGEAFPNVVSEAMCCGTPCVATDVGDSATIVGKAGRICAPRDHKALARAILDIAPRCRDPALSEACRERILKKFTLDRMIEGYQTVWRRSMLGR